MGAAELLTFVGERVGLLPVYALVIGFGSFQASSVRVLMGMLVIMAGIYVTIFQAFDLKQDLDMFGLTGRFGLAPDIANSIAAVIFVFAIGLGVYGLKRLIVRRPRPTQ